MDSNEINSFIRAEHGGMSVDGKKKSPKKLIILGIVVLLAVGGYIYLNGKNGASTGDVSNKERESILNGLKSDQGDAKTINSLKATKTNTEVRNNVLDGLK